MITLQTFLELVDYKITSGGEYTSELYHNEGGGLWWFDHSYGSYTIGCVFDVETSGVLEVSVTNESTKQAWKTTTPEYFWKLHLNPEVAWDDITYQHVDECGIEAIINYLLTSHSEKQLVIT